MNIKYNSENKHTLEITVKLSLQRALLGEVSDNLRMVAADCNDEQNKITVFFYFDGEISPQNAESANCICAEVSGDFDETTSICDTPIRLDFPERLPPHSLTAYLRQEPSL